MSVIHLSGNIWINYLYALVSESCESMVGYTADLEKCLHDAETLMCHAHVCIRVSNVWEFRHGVTMPSLGR
jgi:hypothetical protein